MFYVTCPNPHCPRKSLRVRPEDVQTARKTPLRVRCRRCRQRFVLRPEEVREGPPAGPRRPLWSKMANLFSETIRWPEEPGASDVAPAGEDATSAVPSTGEAGGQATTDYAPNSPPTTAALPEWVDSLPDAPRPSGARGRKPDGDPMPKQIGRFEVRACLGQGGFGKVYRGYDPQLKRPVALKVPAPGAVEAPQLRQRFLDEARAAAGLRHPHIVPIYEVGLDNERPYIVFAFIEGCTLAHAQKRLSRRAAVSIVRDLAEALAYAHQQGIFHRDVKPANVLLDGDDTCHLADFGLAHRQDPAEIGRGQAEAAQKISGTPSHMAPEQWRGEAPQPASDQYSLGVVLYALLCGEPPFECDRHGAFQHCHESEPPPPPRGIDPTVPLDLEAVCLKTLAKKPQERYGDCQQLADDLRRWLEGEPVKARRPGPGERLVRWCRREPRLAAALGSALAFLMAFALMMFYHAAESDRQTKETLEQKGVAEENEAEARRQQKKAEDEEKEAKRQREEAIKNAQRAMRNEAGARIDQALDLCERGEVGQGLVRLADARQLAGDAGAWDLVRVIDANLGGWRRQLHALTTVLRHDDKVTTAALGADAAGRRVVATASGSKVRLWDAEGEPLPLPFPLDPRGKVTALAFGGDKDSLLLVAGQSRLDLWRLSNPAILVASSAELARGPILTASLSRDGKTVLVGGGTEGHKDGWARLWKPQQGEVIDLPGLRDPVYATAFSRDGSQGLVGGGSRFGGAAQVYDADAGRPLGPPLKHDRCVWAAAFSPDGTEVLTGTRGLFEGEAQLWDVGAGRRKGAALVSGLEIFAVAFSPDGKQAAIGGQDRAVRVLDLHSRRLVGSLLRHARDVNRVAFGPDGRTLLTASDDRTACLWQLSAGLLPQQSYPHFGPVLAACGRSEQEQAFRQLFCTGAVVVGLEVSGQARVWDAASGRPLYPPLPHPRPVSAVAWRPRKNMLLTGCWDGKVRLWDLPPGKEPEPRKIIAPTLPAGQSADWVQALAFSPDGKLCVIGWRDGWVEVHDVERDKILWRRRLHKKPLYAIAFSPHKNRFATASQDMTVQQWEWDVMTGKLVRFGKAMEHPDSVLSVAYSSDGAQVLSGYAGGARRWDAQTCEPLGAPFPHQAGVFAVDFGPADTVVLTAGTDRLARLWDVQTGKPLGPAFAHGGAILGAAFLGSGAVMTAGLNWYAHKWPVAGPVVADRKQVVRWAEVVTGIHLRKDGSIGILEPEEWQRRRKELKEPDIEQELRREAAVWPAPIVPKSEPNPNLLVLKGQAPGAKPARRPGAELPAAAVLEVDVSRVRDWQKQMPAHVRHWTALGYDKLLDLHPLLKEAKGELFERIERFTVAASVSLKETRVTVFLHGDFKREDLHRRLEALARLQPGSVEIETGALTVYVFPAKAFQGLGEDVLAAFADNRTLVLSTSRDDLRLALDGGEEGVTLKHKDMTLPRRRLKDGEGLTMSVLMAEEVQALVGFKLPDLQEAATHLVGLTLTVDLPDSGADVHLSLHAQDGQTAEKVVKLLSGLRQQGPEQLGQHPELAKVLKAAEVRADGKTAVLRIPFTKEVIGELVPKKQE